MIQPTIQAKGYKSTKQASLNSKEDSITMASCNPVAPVMDWTEDVELHKRYMEWKEEVELEIGSTLSGKSNSVKSNYVLRWAGKPARDYLKSLPDSEFKYKGANADEILTALEMRTRSLMKLRHSPNCVV